jgi:hypothetical protein
MILIPGDPEFEWTRDNMPPPPRWREHEAHGETGLVEDLNTGLWKPVNQQEFLEVLYEQGDLYFEVD